ncbi:MAG: TRAP transporter substrate-binding protein [Gammaproteobacteria bacterium]|nr:TRAP transporter substrate-binding protein [Gammaproteobacteria bacterium]
MKIVFYIALLLSTPLTLGATTELNLAHMFSDDSLPGEAAEYLAERVEQLSAGTLRIQIFADGYLGDERKNLLAISKGELDLAITGDLVVSYYLPDYAVVNMPFIYRSVEHALQVYNGPLGNQMRKRLQQEHQMIPLSWHYVGTRLLTANRPLRNLSDLQGLKLRLPPDRVWNTSWRALGTLPSPIPFIHLFGALERKRVEAQENPANFIRHKGLHKVQRYLIATRHMPQRQFIMASTTLFSEKLTPRQREILQKAARESSQWLTEVAQQQEEEDIHWLINEGGMIWIDFDATGVSAALQKVPTHLSPQGETILRQIEGTTDEQ